MSSRKRPLVDASVPHLTPSRWAPSTPHAIRALQHLSGAKTRSTLLQRQRTTETIRPDSIRGVLRQFAKISAPVTKKRILTPKNAPAGKENHRPKGQTDDNDDSILLSKPHPTFAIEESLEDDDSVLPVPPTPSILPDDEDEEQSTATFHDFVHIPVERSIDKRSLRRKSRLSYLQSEPITGEEADDRDGDTTIMTERGRRAVSEEATGRLSRYSFGSIHMSEFGSELELRRDSHRHEKIAGSELNDFIPLMGDDEFDDETRNLSRPNRSPSVIAGEDTTHLVSVGDESFRLEMPEVEDEASAREAYNNSFKNRNVAIETQQAESNPQDSELDTEPAEAEVLNPSRRQTLLETAAVDSHIERRKRIKLTRHGTTVPSLATSLIKRVVLESYEKQSRRKPKLGRDHMNALEQATEWFFEQAGEDLCAYSSHGRRKKRINTDDVLLLMRRQKVLLEEGELKALAKSWLPKDLLSDLDLPDTV